MSDDGEPGGELKTQRFNMFMTPSEMAAIDEWAWKNRIRSKSEAVRRLCQIGLQSDRRLDDIIRNTDEAVMRCHDVLAALYNTGLDFSSSEEVAAAFDDALIGIMLPVMDASQEAHGLSQELRTISEAADAKTGPGEAAHKRSEREEDYAAIFEQSEARREDAEKAFAARFRKGKDE